MPQAVTEIAKVSPPAKSPGHASGSSTTHGAAPSLAVSPTGGGKEGDSPISGTPRVARKSGQSPSRPAWVDAQPGRQGDVYRQTATIGPYTTRAECDGKLPDALQTALADYTEIYLGSEAARQIDLPDDQLAEWLIKNQYEETIHALVGPMIQLHVLLEFDHQMQERITDAWQRVRIAHRLWVGRVLAAGLALLALVYGYLKFDLSTAGAIKGWGWPVATALFPPPTGTAGRTWLLWLLVAAVVAAGVAAAILLALAS